VLFLVAPITIRPVAWQSIPVEMPTLRVLRTRWIFQLRSKPSRQIRLSPGLQDAFAVKVNPASGLVYASYLGSASNDTGYAIGVDQAGAAYIAGGKSSANFPITSRAPQPGLQGASNCFIAKVNPAGTALSYATLLGGQSIDLCKGIAVDPSGNAFVSGVTSSANFPVVAALDSALSGSYDVFLAKLSPAGDRLLFSTYLGGESVDEGNATGIGSNGVVYLAGDTASSTFPISSSALQTHNKGGYDGFLCAVADDGSQILWATYLGGRGSDSANSLSVALDGRIIVAGYTASADFPTIGAIQTAFGGDFDAFVAVVEASGTALDFSTLRWRQRGRPSLWRGHAWNESTGLGRTDLVRFRLL